jgi:hypothetical protein
MTATTYPVRLFGGRNLGVTYDSVAGTLSILNVSITLSSLSVALQAQWASAIATTNPSSRPAFAGSNVDQAAGAILDAAPAWRASVQSALAGYVAMNPLNDPETFTRM